MFRSLTVSFASRLSLRCELYDAPKRHSHPMVIPRPKRAHARAAVLRHHLVSNLLSLSVSHLVTLLVILLVRRKITLGCATLIHQRRSAETRVVLRPL